MSYPGIGVLPPILKASTRTGFGWVEKSPVAGIEPTIILVYRWRVKVVEYDQRRRYA